MYSSICTTSASGSRSSRTSVDASRRRTRSNAVAKLSGVVGANHAAAARQHRRLDDDRERHAIEQRRRHRPQPARVMNDGVGSPAAFSFSRVRRLSRAARRRFGRMARQAQQARQIRRHHRRPIADREHARRPAAPRRAFSTRIDRSPLLVKAHGDRAVAPRIVELIAAVGGVDRARRRASTPPRRTCASDSRWSSPAEDTRCPEQTSRELLTSSRRS